MQSVTATFRNGKVELAEAVDWPDGTPVQVSPLRGSEPSNGDLAPPMTHWPEGYFDRLRADWGEEPFERPDQGEIEEREAW